MYTLPLTGTWELSPMDRQAVALHTTYFSQHESTPIVIPGDIHSALLAANIIPDPYVGCNELEVQWVGELDWSLKKEFRFHPEADTHCILRIPQIDTIAEIYMNGQLLGMCDNMFRPWEFCCNHFLDEKNEILVVIRSSVRYASVLAEQLPYEYPYSIFPVYSQHRNLVRKVQCHSGWDWGPCIMCAGLYEGAFLDVIDDFRVTGSEVNAVPIEQSKDWLVSVAIELEVQQPVQIACKVECERESAISYHTLHHGNNQLALELCIPSPEIWWPNGYGSQRLYTVHIDIGSQCIEKQIGFRTLVVDHPMEEGEKGLSFVVNGRPIFIKGANWIPIDALPSRQQPQRYRYLLESAKVTHMNMIRVWGGGQYEKEVFYQLCDELGLLVWHDFMFSCATYPASESFRSSVKDEVSYQVRRLKSHPCIAMWCGNNELVGALGWYEATKTNRPRYLEQYRLLNDQTIGRTVAEIDPDHAWWPSSPCAGIDDYSDNWHNDNAGDMHFWNVWHEGKPFEAYLSIRPRFVSEFGYQSFPWPSLIDTYTSSLQRNLTSVEMEHHQKHPCGNAIIIGNFCRYFRFPVGMAQMVYLSQVQQAIAISTGVEYWRSLRPRCMGAIYWQLNDNWPAASWSSISYEGTWKLLHYAAQRFYQPLLCALLKKDDHYTGVVINDDSDFAGSLLLQYYDFSGNVLMQREYEVSVPSDFSCKIGTWPLRDPLLPEPGMYFVQASLIDRRNEIQSTATMFSAVPKHCHMQNPNLSWQVVRRHELYEVILTALHPAFFVSLDAGPIAGRFSENMVTLLPGERKRISFIPENSEEETSSLASSLRVYDLFGSSVEPM